MSTKPASAASDVGSSKRTGLPIPSLDITVLMGGPSKERDVSFMSGRAVADALIRSGHQVITSDISPENASVLDRDNIDVVFITLHGEFGEDGQVQSICQQKGLAYIGSDLRSSRLAMDKDASKRIFRQAGLPTPEWVVVNRSMTAQHRKGLISSIPLPSVIKPVGGGSSVDVFIVQSQRERSDAVEKLLNEYSKAMVEEFIAGREMTVGILAERALPIIEIRPARPFYDKTAKYEDDATEFIFDLNLPDEVYCYLQDISLKAHNALGCRDFSRVDFILSSYAEPYLLEVNTIPGFTSHSLLPKAAAADGISFEELCNQIVALAWKRARSNQHGTERKRV